MKLFTASVSEKVNCYVWEKLPENNKLELWEFVK